MVTVQRSFRILSSLFFHMAFCILNFVLQKAFSHSFFHPFSLLIFTHRWKKKSIFNEMVTVQRSLRILLFSKYAFDIKRECFISGHLWKGICQSWSVIKKLALYSILVQQKKKGRNKKETGFWNDWRCKKETNI